jgi:hypothetical protein
MKLKRKKRNEDIGQADHKIEDDQATMTEEEKPLKRMKPDLDEYKIYIERKQSLRPILFP